MNVEIHKLDKKKHVKTQEILTQLQNAFQMQLESLRGVKIKLKGIAKFKKIPQ
jgi:hypothetical protein